MHKGPSISARDRTPLPSLPGSVLLHRPPSLPQSILETTPVPHEQGRWQQGRQCRRLGTDLCSGRISVIPVPAAWAPLEFPPGPARN